MDARLKIGFAASEVAPFAKTGGLADVVGSLPAELARLGHDVRVVMPLHRQIDRDAHGLVPVDFIRDVAVAFGPHTFVFSARSARLPGSEVEVLFVECPELFDRPSIYTAESDEIERFAMFPRAVLECFQRLGWSPDILHCNDWHTALAPLLLRTQYEWDQLFVDTASLLTIHNIGYQGQYPAEAIDRAGLRAWAHQLDQGDLTRERVNYLRTGLIHADWISTVSPTYAREIQTEAYGMGLEGLLRSRASRLTGILNGVDYEIWSPENDQFLPHKFSATNLEGKAKTKRYLLDTLRLSHDERAPLIGIISRLTSQKGFELCFDVLPAALHGSDARLVVLGQGEARFEEFFDSLQERFPDRVCYHRGYNDELAHVIEAGSDMFLMPSRYEPCGLNQMFSLRYGTIPIVRRTGGLADSVVQFDPRTGDGSGFVFEHFDVAGLRWALGAALTLWRDRAAWSTLVANAMRQDFSWRAQAERYVELYDRMRRR